MIQISEMNKITIATSTLGMLGGSAAIVHGLTTPDLVSIGLGFAVLLGFGTVLLKVKNNEGIFKSKKREQEED